MRDSPHDSARPHDSAMRAWLRSPQVEAEIAARGRRLWPLPTANLDLIPTMQMIRDEVDIASRIVALGGVGDRPGLIPWIVASTAVARDELAQARPIVIDSRLADALPDWPSPEALTAALTDMRLPFTTTLLTLRNERDWLPLDIELDAPDVDGTHPARWAGCLLRQRAAGELLAIPFATVHPAQPRELSAAAALLVTRHEPKQLPFGVTAMVVRNGAVQIRSWTQPEREEGVRSALEVAFLALDRAAAAIELCNSANVIVRPQELHGKALKLAERKHRLVPWVVQVRKARRFTSPHSGEAPAFSHRFDVRGHFAYYRRGPIFEQHPEKRRWVPELQCEAVPVWRPPHMKGPDHAPYRPKVWLLGDRLVRHWAAEHDEQARRGSNPQPPD